MSETEGPSPRNEAALARFYEERRGDASLWADQPTPAKVRRGRTVVFSLRLPPEELEMLRKEAEARSLSVSELLRRAVSRMIEQERVDAVRFDSKGLTIQRAFEFSEQGASRIMVSREPATSGSVVR